MPDEQKIQTLHPTPGKTNKLITVGRYETIRDAIIAVLRDREMTHTDLMQAIHDRVAGHFDGNAHWYGETVKLDLEARGVIERDSAKPPKYRLK